MTDQVWEKPLVSVSAASKPRSEYLKFVVGGLLMLAAVVYLIVSSTTTGARYFLTVDDVTQKSDYVGKTVRISGAVIGSTIQYDSSKLLIDFTIANIPEDTTDLAKTLHEAVVSKTATRLPVHIENQVMPDILKDEAQAIVTGHIGQDGIFYATELLLKCPSRYQEAVPNQALAGA